MYCRVRKLVPHTSSDDLMVKLNNKQVKWIVSNVISGNTSCVDAASVYEITPRWARGLVKKYKDTGEYPKLNKMRRPKTELTDEQKRLIDLEYPKSFFGARMLRHHIFEEHRKILPQNKIHKYMLEKGYAKQNKNKQKKRKRCRYERKHSLSLLHVDWTKHLGKEVIAIQDDASRNILALGEYVSATTKSSINLCEKAWEELGPLTQFVIALNSDRGPQFYPNYGENKENHKFLIYLNLVGIKHIPSRRNNPQTNGKLERWFQEYKRHRHKFKSAEEFRVWYNNRIHGALNYRRGETPAKAFIKKMRPTIWVGLNFKKIGL